MTKFERARLALIFTGLLFGVSVGSVIAQAVEGNTVRVRIPVCEEDETFLKGKGDFNGQRWERYVCIHPDNL